MARCADCGFLMVRRRGDREAISADQGIREAFINPPDRAAGHRYSMYEDTPLCAENVIKFPSSDNDRGRVALLQEFHTERQCERFTQWVPSLSPKEHREMLDRQWMLNFEVEEREKDRRWREKQRRLDLEWRADQDEKVEQRHEEQLATLKEQQKWQLIVLGLLVTLAIVASTIVGAMIEANWIGSPW